MNPMTLLILGGNTIDSAILVILTPAINVDLSPFIAGDYISVTDDYCVFNLTFKDFFYNIYDSSHLDLTLLQETSIPHH